MSRLGWPAWLRRDGKPQFNPVALLPSPYEDLEITVLDDDTSGPFEVWQDLYSIAPLLTVESKVFRVKARRGIPLYVLRERKSGEYAKSPRVLKVSVNVLSSAAPLDLEAWVRVPLHELTADAPCPPLALRVHEAEADFGFRLLYGEANEAIVEDLNRSLSMVTGAHETVPDIVYELASPNGANPHRFRLESRAVRVDDRKLRDAMAYAQSMRSTFPHYMQFLAVAQAHFATNGEFVRELFMTAPAPDVLTKLPGSATGIAQAIPLKYQEWAKAVAAVQLRQPRFVGDQGNVTAEHPMLTAHLPIRFRNSHYSVGGGNQYVYYEVVPELAELDAMMNLPVDIIADCENINDGSLWCRMVVRFHGTEEDFRRLEHSLPRCHSRITGVRGSEARFMAKLHHACLPGSPLRLPIDPFAVRDYATWLEHFVRATDAVGSGGQIAIGRGLDRQRRLITFDRDERPGLGLFGPSGAGKTVLAALIMISQTPLNMIFHLTPPKEDWLGSFAEAIGGQFLRLDFPNPDNEVEFEAEKRKIDAEVANTIAAWKMQWMEGDFAGLPFVAQKRSGSQALFLHWVTRMQDGGVDALGEALKRHGGRGNVLLDDCVGGLLKDTEWAERTSAVWKHSAQVVMDTVRKYQMGALFTGHSFSGFAIAFGDDFLKELPLAVELPSEKIHTSGRVWYPPNVIVSEIRDTEEPTDAATPDGKPKARPSGYRMTFNPGVGASIIRLLKVSADKS